MNWTYLKISQCVSISLKDMTQENIEFYTYWETLFKVGPNDVTTRRPFRHAPQYEGTCWPTPEIGPATLLILFAILQRWCIDKNELFIDHANNSRKQSFFRSTFRFIWLTGYGFIAMSANCCFCVWISRTIQNMHTNTLCTQRILNM